MENNIARISIDELSLPIVFDCNILTASDSFYHMDRTADFNVLIYVTDGVMYVTEDGKEYDIASGEMLFLKSGLRHYGRYETPRGTSWIYAHFCLHHNQENCKNAMLLPKKISCLSGSVIEEKLYKLCDYFHSSEPMKGLRKNALFYNILLDILTELQPKNESISDKICSYLDTQTDKDFSKELIENRFFMSYSHLAARFRNEKGITMGQYHNNARMRRACHLLRSTLMSVGEIAYCLGFSDMLYFSKKFHVYSGASPTDYRKQAQKEY